MSSPVQPGDLESCTISPISTSFIVNNNNNKSIDSTILNSPSSLHRLQTLTRKQRTPFSSSIRSTTEVSAIHQLDSIDLNAISPDSVSAATGAGVMSNSSSVLYLSDCFLTDVATTSSLSEQILKDKRNSYTQDHHVHHHKFNSNTFSFASARHSIAYYLAMPRLDQFFNWTQILCQLAFYVLPLVWTLSAIGWIVYLRKKNQLLRNQLLTDSSLTINQDMTNILDDNIIATTSSITTIDSRKTLDPSIEHSFAVGLTLLAVLFTLAFGFIYVIKSNWAYSFEFVPNEEEYTSEFDSVITNSIQSGLPTSDYIIDSEVVVKNCSNDHLVNMINPCTDNSVRL